MTGANSAARLRSMAARYLFLDEVGGYPGGVEGDPVNPAMARTRTFAPHDLRRLDAQDHGHVADRGGVRGERPPAILRAVPDVPGVRSPALLSVAVAQRPARQGGIRLPALRTAGGARIPSRCGTARRQDSICPACTHRWAGFRGRCRRAARASVKEPGAPPRRGSGLEAPVRPARAVQDRDRASWRRIPHRGRTRPEGLHRGDSSP